MIGWKKGNITFCNKTYLLQASSKGINLQRATFSFHQEISVTKLGKTSVTQLQHTNLLGQSQTSSILEQLLHLLSPKRTLFGWKANIKESHYLCFFLEAEKEGDRCKLLLQLICTEEFPFGYKQQGHQSFSKVV